MWWPDPLHITYRTAARMSIEAARARSVTYGWFRNCELRHATNTRVSSTYSEKSLLSRMRSTRGNFDPDEYAVPSIWGDEMAAASAVHSGRILMDRKGRIG